VNLFKLIAVTLILSACQTGSISQFTTSSGEEAAKITLPAVIAEVYLASGDFSEMEVDKNTLGFITKPQSAFVLESGSKLYLVSSNTGHAALTIMQPTPLINHQFVLDEDGDLTIIESKRNILALESLNIDALHTEIKGSRLLLKWRWGNDTETVQIRLRFAGNTTETYTIERGFSGVQYLQLPAAKPWKS
jgi:hypothetical protein